MTDIDPADVRWNCYRGALGAAVLPGKTVDLPYPSETTAGKPYPGNLNRSEEVVIVNDSNRYTAEHFEIEYGDTTFTLKNNSGEAWPAGGTLYVQFPLPEKE